MTRDHGGAGKCEGGARRVLLQRSPYAEDQGELIGCDPRKITPEDWKAAGIEPVGVMRAIRAKCLDCVGYQPGEVRKCMGNIWNFDGPCRTIRAQPNPAPGA